MASIARTILQRSRKRPPRIRCRSSFKLTAQWQSPFSTSSVCFVDEDPKDAPLDEGSSGPIETAVKENITESSENIQKTPPTLRDKYPGPKVMHDLSHEEQWMHRQAIEDYMTSGLDDEWHELDEDVIKENVRTGKHGHKYGNMPGLSDDDDFEIEQEDRKKVLQGFWAEGEEELGPDDDYFGDDITSAGDGELQKMRDLREYARLIAWELPLLSQLARPFEPPPAETPFRFRYTSYFGERHPAVNKVVVEFCPKDLDLTEPQQSKLIKLAGPRYNPDSTIVKLSCEKFDTQTQNKRYLGETIESLVTEAMDAKDMFDDVPFDFRHHKPKKRFEFPEEWVLTKERKQALDEKRQRSALLEDDRMHTGKLIDGKKIIDTSLPFTEPEPVTVNAPGTYRLR